MLGSMADLSGQRLGGYTLLERIGRGGMSSVYRAKHDEGTQEVALKVLVLDPQQEDSPVFLERFKQEVDIIHNLQHDNILPLLDYATHDEYMYFVMPLILGGTLVDIIKQNSVMQSEAVSYWLAQIAAALDYAHQRNVIHRDLKPSNVLIDAEHQHAFLTDFGIAKLTTFTSNLTQTGNVIGTPAYMAPEQWRDEPLDARTDVYGLGVMAYVMLTAHTPFESEKAHSMMYQHLNEEPPSPQVYIGSVPDSVAQVILMALAKNPQDRYPTAGVFADDFRKAVLGQPTLAATAKQKTPRAQPAVPAVTPTIEMPSSDSFPAPPAVLEYEHLRRKQRSSFPYPLLAAMTLGVTVLAVVIGAVIMLLLGVFDTDDSRPNSDAPTALPTADSRLDVPRIRLDNPVESPAQMRLGETIDIRVVIFDANGITRVELQDENGGVIQGLDVANATRYDAQFTYRPRVTGEHRLAVVAYRGTIASDPRIVTIQVQSGG